MKEAKNIAVVGATGLVGKTFLQLLESDHFLDSDIHLLASKKSEGKEAVSYTHLTLPTILLV